MGQKERAYFKKSEQGSFLPLFGVLSVSVLGLCGVGGAYYITHLEKTPITGELNNGFDTNICAYV